MYVRACLSSARVRDNPYQLQRILIYKKVYTQVLQNVCL